MTPRVTDLWTGYERHAGLWYAMNCNVDLDQAERNKRNDLVWIRNSEVATAAAEIATLRAKLEAVCEAGEKRVSGSEHDALCPGNRLRKVPCTCGYEALDDAIAAAREGKP